MKPIQNRNSHAKYAWETAKNLPEKNPPQHLLANFVAQSLEPLRDPNVFSSAPWEPFPPGRWPPAVPAPGSSQSPQTKWSRSTTKDPGAPAAWAEAETGTSPPGAVGFFEQRWDIFWGSYGGVVKGYTHTDININIYILYYIILYYIILYYIILYNIILYYIILYWLIGWLIGWLVD